MVKITTVRYELNEDDMRVILAEAIGDKVKRFVDPAEVKIYKRRTEDSPLIAKYHCSVTMEEEEGEKK